MEVDLFIDKFGGFTEKYLFYDGTVELRYEPKEHVYYLVTNRGLIAQDGVTSVCGIIDKSEALIPWACKMMAEKLLNTIPRDSIDEKWIGVMPIAAFEQYVKAAKSAHKDKLEEAANIGHLAHNWIERQIRNTLAAGKHSLSELKALDPAPEDPRVISCCLAAVMWMSDHNIRWLETEKKIYSLRYEYAGTMDGLCYASSCRDPSCCPEPFKDRLSLMDWKTSNHLYPEYLLQTAAYQYAYMEEHKVVIEDRWIIRLGKQDAAFEKWHLTGEDFNEDIDAFLDALSLSRTIQIVRNRAERREKEGKDAIRAEKEKARQEALTIKCQKADRYKGHRYPSCNGGDPCQTCLSKYRQTPRKGEQ